MSAGAGQPVAREEIGLLLVEDDEGDARLVEDELAERLPAARIRRSRTLGEALQVLDAQIDCVLLDLGLPDTRGMDAVARLRAAMPAVPLIVLTGLNTGRRRACGGRSRRAGLSRQGKRRRRAAGALDPLRDRPPASGGCRARAAAGRGADARGRAPGKRPGAKAAARRSDAVGRLAAIARGAAVRCSAATSSTSCAATTAVCTCSSATSAVAAPTKRRSASACAPPGARWRWRAPSRSRCC